MTELAHRGAEGRSANPRGPEPVLPPGNADGPRCCMRPEDRVRLRHMLDAANERSPSPVGELARTSGRPAVRLGDREYVEIIGEPLERIGQTRNPPVGCLGRHIECASLGPRLLRHQPGRPLGARWREDLPPLVEGFPDSGKQGHAYFRKTKRSLHWLRAQESACPARGREFCDKPARRP